MKLYYFLYKHENYDGVLRKIIYQSFNEDELKKIRQELVIKCNYLSGFNSVGEIENFEVDIKNGVWTA